MCMHGMLCFVAGEGRPFRKLRLDVPRSFNLQAGINF